MDWMLNMQPIGTVQTCFPCKNGTPRQPTIASNARGQLKIRKDIYNNPAHSLEGLQEFSHVWLIFVFHKNKSGKFAKPKVSPPRLNGAKMGVFATRSPYRLNPLGLSLVKLDCVEGDTLHFSGHDLVDGTPVLDVKPYIEEYDSPMSRNRARDSCSGPPAQDPRLSDDVVPRPDEHKVSVNNADPPETPSSLSAGSLSRPCASDKRETLPRSDNADRPHDSPDTLTEVRSKESPSSRRRHPQLVNDHAGAKCRDPAESQRMGNSPEPPSPATSPSRPHVTGDSPVHSDPSASCSGDTWLSRLRPEQWTVSFTAWAESQLQRFSASEEAGPYRLRWLRDSTELRGALEELLTADPRSVYRRAQNDQLLYHLALDTSHITCWFDPSRRAIEVLRLQPLSESPLAEVTSRVAKDRASVNRSAVEEPPVM